MDCKKKHNNSCVTDMGRGCTFCNCNEEPMAHACEGCFKLHAENWLEDYPDVFPDDIFEVRFKNTRKSYYKNVNNLPLKKGDVVAVEASPGHDIGIVSLTGDMVAKQMKRIGFTPMNGEFKKIYRKAKPYDIEKWQESIAMEHETMIRSRQIASELNLNMKIGDVEYQGDKIKAIFYYIADERVDFRELIKVFAEQFKVRVEMKQIGARQEAGRIGGLGSCGRELCCASWVSSFVSVTTNAARTQEISLNPQKLAGQCSKLKCCLIYELDTYLDARKSFPRVNQPLQAMDGEYYLIKTDILGGTMSFSTSPHEIVGFITLPVERVKEILDLNRKGKKVDRLEGDKVAEAKVEEPTFVNMVGEDSITRFDSKKEGGRNSGGRNNRKGNVKGVNSSDGNGKAEQRGAEGGNNGNGGNRRQNHKGGGGSGSNSNGNGIPRNGSESQKGDSKDGVGSEGNNRRERNDRTPRPANGGNNQQRPERNNSNKEGGSPVEGEQRKPNPNRPKRSNRSAGRPNNSKGDDKQSGTNSQPQKED